MTRTTHLIDLVYSFRHSGYAIVEATDNQCYSLLAVFSGPGAQERATEYADWKNHIRTQPTVSGFSVAAPVIFKAEDKLPQERDQ